MSKNNLLEELSWRGLISQTTEFEKLSDHLLGGKRVVYCGFDPSADSLHVGSLVPLLALKRFQESGHKPIILIGGSTGLIGDPSFRDAERPLLDKDTVSDYVAALTKQVGQFVNLEGPNAAKVVNNLDWTSNMPVIKFLRDIGKHFSVNSMIQRDSVRTRIDRDGEGISYTEFSYMLLQAMDFLELARSEGCTIQIGGSDQWGNMVSGVDLIRRELGVEAHAVTLPLVTKADGTKFGKSSSGAIWLDKTKTSPYAFHQFWLNSADKDVIRFLKYFTFLQTKEIEGCLQEATERPQDRYAQNQLADILTTLVHGKESLQSAKRIALALFGGNILQLKEEDFKQLAMDGLGMFEVEPPIGLLAAMADSALVKSRAEARQLVKSGGVSLNGGLITLESFEMDFSDALFGRYYLLRRGKKNYKLFVKASK